MSPSQVSYGVSDVSTLVDIDHMFTMGLHYVTAICVYLQDQENAYLPERKKKNIREKVNNMKDTTSSKICREHLTLLTPRIIFLN